MYGNLKTKSLESCSVLASPDTLVWSPWELFIFVVKVILIWSKNPNNIFYILWTKPVDSRQESGDAPTKNARKTYCTPSPTIMSGCRRHIRKFLAVRWYAWTQIDAASESMRLSGALIVPFLSIFTATKSVFWADSLLGPRSSANASFFVEFHEFLLGSSACFLDEISVTSPQALFIFVITKNVFWITVSKQTFYSILKAEALPGSEGCFQY